MLVSLRTALATRIPLEDVATTLTTAAGLMAPSWGHRLGTIGLIALVVRFFL